MKTTIDSPNHEPWIDSRTAAALLGRQRINSYKSIERKAKAGEIPAYFQFNRWYFLASELDAWIKSGVHSGSQSRRVN